MPEVKVFTEIPSLRRCKHKCIIILNKRFTNRLYVVDNIMIILRSAEVMKLVTFTLIFFKCKFI
jgi:hypothetical protein